MCGRGSMALVGRCVGVVGVIDFLIFFPYFLFFCLFDSLHTVFPINAPHLCYPLFLLLLPSFPASPLRAVRCGTITNAF